jgi:deazaflavin-dependent oxidoreductase (nitroreductase family)
MARTGAPRGAVRRTLNAMMTAALRRGLGPPGIWLLETRGRKTGTPRTTPVSLVEDETGRYLVSPYGTPAWVQNARAAGQVTLRRGRRADTVAITELGPQESGAVLKRYVTEQRIVRPWFDAGPGDPAEVFAAEAARHPVFRLSQPSRPAIPSRSTTYSR